MCPSQWGQHLSLCLKQQITSLHSKNSWLLSCCIWLSRNLITTTFYTIKVFVILLIHYIFVIFLSQLENKPHKSRNLFCFTHWTHSFLNHMPIYIGPPIAWTNSDVWTRTYQLVQPRISLLFPVWYTLNVAWILRIICQSSFVFL